MHIVFQQAGKDVLEQGLEPDNAIDKKVIYLKSDYSFGPVEYPVSDENPRKRNEWWKNIANDENNQSFTEVDDEDIRIIKEIKASLENNEGVELWIWIAPNKQDVSGYYFLLSHLSEFTGKLFVVWLNNLPFINDKGQIFYPKYLSEIPSKEFLKAKKLYRAVTFGELEVDLDEWNKLCQENKAVRILKDHKKLVQHDEAYFDKTIQSFITTDWQKVSKVFQQFNHKSSETLPEELFLSRIRNLIALTDIQSQGNPADKKEWEIKKGTEAVIAPE
ncbi:MAG: DUF1835 domain-containing protein [Bacteroidetes bacterium]|nr:DUF1835 domain-containing protein [Bacteroidota bacterium]